MLTLVVIGTLLYFFHSNNPSTLCQGDCLMGKRMDLSQTTKKTVCSMLGLSMFLFVSPANAYVKSFDIVSRSPAFDGKVFGKVGAYERIDAIAHFAIDSETARAQKIVDLNLAPKNDKGEVEYSSQVVILRPVNYPSQTLYYEVTNRGWNLSYTIFDYGKDAVNPVPGDGLLMRQGYTLVWSGWQTDIKPGLLSMQLPVLKGVTGLSREETIFDDNEKVSEMKLSYPVADRKSGHAELTVRETPEAPRQTPKDLTFTYVDDKTIKIHRPSKVDAGAIYEFVYTAKDPVPAGLGFVGVSDLVSFLRGNKGHKATSPIEGIKHTLGVGISQSGRFLRDFIYQGFNADENSHKVFDGAFVHVAGSRKTFTNYRFAQPGRFSRQHEDHDFPGDQFPFTYAVTKDPISGKTDGIFAQCEENDTCPKLIHTDSDTEFWQARSSLVSTSVSDGSPVPVPENVRLYYLTGTPHYNEWGVKPEKMAASQALSNPTTPTPILRGLLIDLDEWVNRDITPPDSVFPGLTKGSVVSPETLKIPAFEGSAIHAINKLRLRGSELVNAKEGPYYPVKVPKVDRDGTPIGGVTLPEISVPTGTYTGWNLRAKGYAEGDLYTYYGSYIPFPLTSTKSDWRQPLSERYADITTYRNAITSATNKLVKDRFMIPEDVSRVVEMAVANYPKP